MSGVFQNIDLPPLSPPGECVGVNILEDARHSSVLYICMYFVVLGHLRSEKDLRLWLASWQRF
jgi:hypothetical protein